MDRRRHQSIKPVLRAEGDAHLTPFRYQTKWDMDYGMAADTAWFTFGLVDYGLRYYNPKHGRFINRDPIGDGARQRGDGQSHGLARRAPTRAPEGSRQVQAGGLNLYEAFGGDPVNRWDFLGLNDMNHVPTYGSGDEELDAFLVTGSNLSALAAAQFHMQNRGRILSLRIDGQAALGAQHEYAPPYTNWRSVDKPGPPNRRNEQFLGDGKVYDLDPVEVVAQGGSSVLGRHQYDHIFLKHYFNPMNAAIYGRNLALNGVAYGPVFNLNEKGLVEAFQSTPATQEAIMQARQEVLSVAFASSSGGVFEGSLGPRVVNNTDYIFSLGKRHS